MTQVAPNPVNTEAYFQTLEADFKTPNNHNQGMLKKVATASFLGNFIEWFDYAAYSYFATAIAMTFFPTEDRTIALLQTFGIFALSFILRPLGAIFWGNLGDRIGRKATLSLSIVMMTGASFLIGLLPSYAAIGALAPICLLLLRMIQGFSASGEYAGAAVFLGEYAPPRRRGFLCSLIPASTALGLLAGSAFASIMSVLLTHDQVVAWGWRIPFLLALPFGAIIFYIRARLEDSPVYQEMSEAVEGKHMPATKSPIKLLLTTYRKQTLISFGAAVLNAVGFYIVLTYLPTYLTDTVHMDATAASTVTTISLIVYVALVFGMGKLSDRYGRKKMLLIACISFIALTIPGFMLIGTGNVFLVLAMQIALSAALAANDGSLASYLNETFPTEVRFSGFAFSFNMANAIFGGTAPFIATWLIYTTDSALAPAIYMALVATITLVALKLSAENSTKNLTSI